MIGSSGLTGSLHLSQMTCHACARVLQQKPGSAHSFAGRLFVKAITSLQIGLLAPLCTSGCSMDESLLRSQQTVSVARAQMHQAREVFNNPHASRESQVVQKPWVSGKPVALAADVTMPEALRTQVRTTLIFKDSKTTLTQVASRIALATSIPVRVMPDALLPSHHFMPRLQGLDGAERQIRPNQLPMPSGTYALAKILDIVAAEHDVHWRYTKRGIEVYRTETRVFDVRALSLSAGSEMRLGRGGSSDSEGFQSSAQTTLTLASEPALQAIKHRLEPFLTRAGVVSAQPGSLTSIVVTDTPGALDGIASYLESVNRSMSLRVRLVFEEMTVTRKEGQEQGMDWSLAFARGLMALGAGNRQSSAAAPAVQVSASAGPLSASLTVRALSGYANVLRHTAVPVVTLNRRPVTHAVRSTFTYVDQVKALVTPHTKDGDPASSQPGVAISQKRETTGAFLTLVPDVQEDGQILLSVAYDNTVAMPLSSLHFGSQSSPYQVQQLTVHGTGTVQQVALRAGSPVLIAGFEEREEQNEGSRLAPSLPRAAGGFDKVSQQQRMTLIFVTAQIEEGL